jgi:PAS domain S-box-containing protein
MDTALEKLVCNAIERADSLVFCLDSLGKVMACNRRFEDILGVAKERVMGNDYFQFICAHAKPSAKEQMFKAMIDDAIKYKRSNSFEGIITDCKKNEHFICWGISPILAEDKELEGILCMGNDVTSSREREGSFKSIDDTLKNIFLSIKEYALYAINLDGNIIYFGMGSEAMFGWHKNEIIFKHISELHAYDEIAYKLPFILEQVKNFGRYELETYFIRKDGQSFPVSLTITKFMDAAGDTIGYIFMAKDITERRRLEYQIFQSEKLAAVGQLVAGIAHEINNPVFVISGRADLLIERKTLDKSVKKELKTISKQVDRIRRLVDRFLSFTRKSIPNTQVLDINKVIRELLPLLSYHKLPAHHIRLVKSFATRLPKITGDAHQLQEVFLNLLINAYQAMPQGGVITVKTEDLSGEFVRITVSDTGCGISPEGIKNLFMPFFSTKKEGTGLGLSICYNIIKNHGGSIDVESQMGKGTVFTVKIPFIKKRRE